MRIHKSTFVLIILSLCYGGCAQLHDTQIYKMTSDQYSDSLGGLTELQLAGKIGVIDQKEAVLLRLQIGPLMDEYEAHIYKQEWMQARMKYAQVAPLVARLVAMELYLRKEVLFNESGDTNDDIPSIDGNDRRGEADRTNSKIGPTGHRRWPTAVRRRNETSKPTAQTAGSWFR